MQDVPKIARQRLKAAKPAATHPDADVLTAFTERSLPVDERAAVLEHLSRCGDCRHIVALSLPATEAIGTVVRPPARGWLTWPALRWGLVAAGVVAIASLGIVQYQRGMRSRNMAATAPARIEVAVKEAKNQPPAPPVPSVEKRDKMQTSPTSTVTNFVDSTDSIGGTKKSLAHEEPALPLRPQVHGDRGGALAGANLIAGRQFPHGPRLANQMNQMQAVAPAMASQEAQQQAGKLAANMQVPAVSETVAVDAHQLDVNAKNLVPLPLQNQPGTSQSPGEGYALSRAKPPVTDQASGGAASDLKVAAPVPADGPALAASLSAPRWTISSAGGLQRSFDHGNTWQDVDVNSGPAFASSSVQRTARASLAKEKDAEKQQRAATFRAVSATGSDVWAGGSGLYHSQDAGLHWTRVVPASAGTALTGEIVSVEFADLQHGKVSTSTAEIWTTVDDGQTWQKQ
jgi:hypothetical protein